MTKGNNILRGCALSLTKWESMHSEQELNQCCTEWMKPFLAVEDLGPRDHPPHYLNNSPILFSIIHHQIQVNAGHSPSRNWGKILPQVTSGSRWDLWLTEEYVYSTFKTHMGLPEMSWWHPGVSGTPGRVLLGTVSSFSLLRRTTIYTAWKGGEIRFLYDPIRRYPHPPMCLK